MEKFFHLKENGTTVSTEIMAGLTTFFAMSYIIIVNPQILSSTGMPWGGVFLATIIAAIIGTLVMGLFANVPYAQAAGMGGEMRHRLAAGMVGDVLRPDAGPVLPPVLRAASLGLRLGAQPGQLLQRRIGPHHARQRVAVGDGNGGKPQFGSTGHQFFGV